MFKFSSWPGSYWSHGRGLREILQDLVVVQRIDSLCVFVCAGRMWFQ